MVPEHSIEGLVGVSKSKKAVVCLLEIADVLDTGYQAGVTVLLAEQVQHQQFDNTIKESVFK